MYYAHDVFTCMERAAWVGGCLERGELALIFMIFKEVGGKENWEGPASLMGLDLNLL